MSEKDVRERIQQIDTLRRTIESIDAMLDGMFITADVSMDVPRTVRRRLRYQNRVEEYKMNTEEVRIFNDYLRTRRYQLEKDVQKLSAEFES